MTKVLAVCQARMGSQRLPGKVMKDLGGKPLLRWTYDACIKAQLIDEVVIATSTLVADDQIADYCKKNGIKCFRGSESDVLDRFYQCAKKYHADIVLRFTCDCCFLDPNVIDQVIKLREMTNADYASCCYPANWPDGLDTECFTFSALEASWTEAKNQIDRDCLTQYIIRNRDRFKVVNLDCPLPGLHNEHWVCDSANDFVFCERVVMALSNHGVNLPPSYVDILSVLDSQPELREINKGSIRNERFYEALSEERLSPRTFERSKRIFERATKVIPLGAQTYSKAAIQFPAGNSPLYASHGDGAYIFDVDGNRYVDLINAIYPVVLGYCDPTVDGAIRNHLDNGISFSLGTNLEVELAETLCRLIPCAEMVKFGKTGTDVTTAAVRLARYYTQKWLVLYTGYHGWADWSMAHTNRNGGIEPLGEIQDYNDRIEYGKKEIYDFWLDSTAAIIVEPNDDPDYLKWLRELCDKRGIVLIFDEIITGFRYDLGGAQKLYGVTPDLACFGKSMANGMPISALVGKREIMKLMETPDVFYSGTFFGETLSIAAAIATINKLEKENVIDYLCKMGARLEHEILRLLNKYNLNNYILLDGWYPCQKLSFKTNLASNIRSLFMQTMFQNGVLIMASNNLSYAIKEPEFKRIVTAYDKAFETISKIKIKDLENIKPVEAAPLRVMA